MLNDSILETSKAVFLTKAAVSYYQYLIKLVKFLYRESLICNMKNKFWEGFKNNLKFSFLVRVTEIKKKQRDDFIFKDSTFVKFFARVFMISKEKTNKCLIDSKVFFFTQWLRNEFYFKPVRLIGFTGLTASLINMILSVLLRKNISILGCFIWLSFILLGLCGFISNVEWHDLKRYSFVLSKMNSIKTNEKE